MKSSENLIKVEFYLGTGGVGKSTISALNAVNSAMSGKQVLIATFDPSLRLKDLLIKENGYANPLLKQNLHVHILDPKSVFEELLGQVDADTAKNVKSNKLFAHLIERIQGVQEFSSLYFLNTKLKSQKFDLIIIDTPPLQNSLDFFSSPEKLQDLFESTIVKLFIGDFNKNWLEEIFKKTRDIAFSTLKKLTGLEFFEQLISLMKALETLQPVILETLKQSQQILVSENTTYKFITSYDSTRLDQSLMQIEQMKIKNIKISTLIINKFENLETQDIEDSIELAKNKKLNVLGKHLVYLKEAYSERKNRIQNIKENRKMTTVLVPNFLSQISTEEDLINQSKVMYE